MILLLLFIKSKILVKKKHTLFHFTDSHYLSLTSALLGRHAIFYPHPRLVFETETYRLVDSVN